MIFNFETYVVLWYVGFSLGIIYLSTNFGKKWIGKHKKIDVIAGLLCSLITGFFMYLSILLQETAFFYLFGDRPIQPEEKYLSLIVYIGIIITISTLTVFFSVTKKHSYSQVRI